MADKIFKELPKIHTTYASVIKSLIPIGEHHAKSLPTSVYQVQKLVIDEANLKEYRKICKFVDDGRVPPTYFAVLSQTLQMNMMAKEDFPFVMLGLVHIENSVTQYQPIFDTQTVCMRVHLDNLKAHDKGQQFDFITKVTIGDELVWEGVSTYLSRQKKQPPKKESQTPDMPTSVQTQMLLTENEAKTAELFEVSEDIGRRYAFVSGDFNLIHLHPLSARAFGFPKAIAHGMWSKAYCLAQFHDLPHAYRVDVSFKTPIFLPSKVKFLAKKVQTGRQFALTTEKGDKPHLMGEITYL